MGLLVFFRRSVVSVLDCCMTMTHQSLLDGLAAKHLTLAMRDDVARLTADAMAFEKGSGLPDRSAYVLPYLLRRWNCVLLAMKGVADLYKHKTAVALAATLHQHGFASSATTALACNAIDALNKAVALSDSFARKSEAYKALLQTLPSPLERKPALPENITFYRPKDVICIQLDNRFYAAYISKLTGPNESPIIEFYDQVFDEVPSWSQLQSVCAKGLLYNDGVAHVNRYGVCGMKYQPDLANQVTLVASCIDTPPDSGHLAESTGLYMGANLVTLGDTIDSLFH
jgi:hypothetical protein